MSCLQPPSPNKHFSWAGGQDYLAMFLLQWVGTYGEKAARFRSKSFQQVAVKGRDTCRHYGPTPPEFKETSKTRPLKKPAMAPVHSALTQLAFSDTFRLPAAHESAAVRVLHRVQSAHYSWALKPHGSQHRKSGCQLGMGCLCLDL